MQRNRGLRGYRFKQAEAKSQARGRYEVRPATHGVLALQREAKLARALVARADQWLAERTGHQAEP